MAAGFQHLRLRRGRHQATCVPTRTLQLSTCPAPWDTARLPRAKVDAPSSARKGVAAAVMNRVHLHRSVE